MNQIMKQAQQMQQKLSQVQAELADRTVSASVGGGMVTVTVNGKNELLSIDGNPVPSDSINALQLFYYQKNENKSTLINTFNPIFAGEQLKAEVQVILDELSDKSFEEKFESVYLYMIEFYCHPDESNLRVWLKSNFDI